MTTRSYPALRAFLSWFALCLALGAPLAHAQDAESRATQAVVDILFDANADDFTTYRVTERGFVDVNFASNTPDKIYSELLAKLKSHPDIKGVLAGKSLAPCRRF